VTAIKIGLVAAIWVVLLPTGATAKEISSVTICGGSGCRTIERPGDEIASGGDGIPDPAPALAPYYTVTLTSEAEGIGDSWQVFLVPSPPYVAFRGDDGRVVFERLDGGALRAFRTATRGLVPYPAPAITGATVGGKSVIDPGSYAELLTLEGEGAPATTAADFVPVLLHSTRPTPWTDLRYHMFSPSTGTLERGATRITLADGVAAAVASGASIDGAAVAGGGSVVPGEPAVVPVVLVGLLAIAAGAWLAVRRLRRPAAA
jgi:hypothetical protein